jgi:lipopolysaccharide transport system permease protein
MAGTSRAPGIGPGRDRARGVESRQHGVANGDDPGRDAGAFACNRGVCRVRIAPQPPVEPTLTNHLSYSHPSEQGDAVVNDQPSVGLMDRRVDGPSEDVELHEIVLRPSVGWVPVDWHELVATRELFFTLISRDLRVRYKQTVLGVAWAVVQPLASMIVFTLVFGRLIPDVDTRGVPYPLFVYAGLVPWTFFSNAVNAAGISLISQQHMMSKIYFPRAYAPATTVGTALVDMAIAFGLFALLLPMYRVVPSWQIVFLPAVVLLMFLGTLGIGLWTSALVVLFRDIRYVLVFALQILLYLSPVIYPHTQFPERYRWILALNPMFGLISAFRSSIFGVTWDPAIVAISSISAVAMFVFGIYFFRRIERHIADVL